MATKHTSTASAAPSTIQTIAVLGLPLWITLLVLLNAVVTGEVSL